MTEMPPYLDSNDDEKDSEAVDSDTSADVNDWELPLSFDELRHREPIKGEERVEHSWRLKEKVSRGLQAPGPRAARLLPCAVTTERSKQTRMVQCQWRLASLHAQQTTE